MTMHPAMVSFNSNQLAHHWTAGEKFTKTNHMAHPKKKPIYNQLAHQKTNPNKDITKY